MRPVTIIAVGAVLLHLSGIAALVGLMAVLQPLLPLWATAVIIAVFLGVVSMAMMQVGMRALRNLDPLPKDTLRTLRPDRI